MGYVLEKKFEYKGYLCAVCIMDLGHRCGYVGVPKNNKYYGVAYHDMDICTHGGLTYSGGNSDYPIKEDNDLWWFGWDYAHYMDAKDEEAYIRYFGREHYEKHPYLFYGNSGKVYYLDDVEADCKRVVEQLIELEGINE